MKNLGGKKNAGVSAYWMCGVTKSGWIQKKFQKTPSEKSGDIVSSVYLRPLHLG
jgi:hypothetical protein